MTESMTRREREDLAKVTRLRAKVAKDGITAREAALLADVEEQLSAVYRFDHDAWADITRHAEQVVAEADKQIAQRCRELGIRESFRPHRPRSQRWARTRRWRSTPAPPMC
jgi:hypothetical protein